LGTSHLVNSNFPEALRELLAAEKLNPKSKEVHNALCLAYMVREKYQKAEAHALTALNLDPTYTDARNNLGRVYIEQKQYDLAIDVLTDASEDLTYSTPEKVFSNLGLAYLKNGDYDQAKESLRRSLKIRRKHCATMNNYGHSLFLLKRFEQAARSFDQAIEICKKNEPQLPEPYYYSGLSYWKIGRHKLSLSKLKEVITYFPGSDMANRAQQMISLIKRATP